MVAAGAMVPIMVATAHTSSYRVKFRRKEFLELVQSAKPKIIYRTKRIHFFTYDGFVMYAFDYSVQRACYLQAQKLSNILKHSQNLGGDLINLISEEIGIIQAKQLLMIHP